MKKNIRSTQLLKYVSVFVCCVVIFTSSGLAFASPAASATPSAALIANTAAGVWELVPSTTTNNLMSVDFSSPTSGWAGGSNVLLRYNGVAWQSFSAPALGANYWVSSISMLTDTDGWLVGSAKKANPYYETVILHWDGAQWNEVASPTSFALMGVSAVDNAHVYTVGGGTLCSPACDDLLGWAFLWNGSSWSSTSVGSHRRVTDVDVVSSSDGWMVGDEKNTTTNQYHALAMRWVGGSWQSVGLPDVFNNRLYAVSALDANHAWAVGLFEILRWSGSAWELVPIPAIHALLDVLAISPNDAWVVGELGIMYHWDGVSWTAVNSPVTSDLNALAKASPFDVWAVGNGGVILHYKQANVTTNHHSGAPGSYFNVSARNFSPGEEVVISVNGQTVQTTSADAQGNLTVTLSTSGIEEGAYVVHITAASAKAVVMFWIDSGAPTRDREDTFTVYSLPAGIGYGYSVFVPIIGN
jgi:hypothetical protein